MSRSIRRRYEDPLDRIWLTTAERLGLRVVRTADAFATTDGRGALRLGAAASLDPDDCLAQMIFHELCHSLVQGPESFDVPDWGLENRDPRDLAREHACLRAQAWLASRYGLRRVLAPTTEHRRFFDELGVDPLDGPEDSVTLGRRAVARARRSPWAPHLEDALRASAAVVRAAAPFGGDGSLLSDLDQARPEHPAGGFVHPRPELGTCGDCAWGADRCVVHNRAVEPRWPACESWVGALDCRACAACCREGFDVVELDLDDPFLRSERALVEVIDGRFVLRRVDGRCPPLRDEGGARPFTCAVYEERPRACREFERGSQSCLWARRRVGLTV